MIYQHISASSLIPFLIPFLPSSIPLLRRLQNPRRSPSSLILSTFSPFSPVPEIFIAAFVDQSCTITVQSWFYCSLEAVSLEKGRLGGETEEIVKSQMRELLQYIKYHPPVPQFLSPTLINNPGDKAPEYNNLRIGSLHLMLVDAVEAISKAPMWISDVWSKHIFRGTLAMEELDEKLLPCGVQYGTLKPEDIRLVVEASPYPRTAQSMGPLKNAAIFTTSSSGDLVPVAWCFIALDGSLEAWHVEEPWRKKGLGLAVARRLLEVMRRDGMREDAGRAEQVSGVEEVWGHIDIKLSNEGSRKGIVKLGAEMGWEVKWVNVDLRGVE